MKLFGCIIALLTLYTSAFADCITPPAAAPCFVRTQPAYQIQGANAVEAISARGVASTISGALGGQRPGTMWSFLQQVDGATIATALRYGQFTAAAYNSITTLAPTVFSGYDIKNSLATQNNDTYFPSTFNPGIAPEVWIMLGDSIMYSKVDASDVTDWSWSQPVVGTGVSYLYHDNGTYTNQPQEVWTKRYWNTAGRVLINNSGPGRVAYGIPGITYANPVFDTSHGLAQGYSVTANQTIGFVLEYGTNDFNDLSAGFSLFGSPTVSGAAPFSLTTTLDLPAGTMLTFAGGTTGVQNGYLVSGTNISAAPGGTPLAPADSRNTYVSSFTGTTVTLNQAVTGDVGLGTVVTFTPPNLIDNYVIPAVAYIRSLYTDRSKTKIVFAVPIARGPSANGANINPQFSAFRTYLNANIVALNIDAVADTWLIPCFNAATIDLNACYRGGAGGDNIHPSEPTGMILLGGGSVPNGVSGSWARAMEHAMGRP